MDWRILIPEKKLQKSIEVELENCIIQKKAALIGFWFRGLSG